jgi:uncharacterized protein (TIGR02996 family)
MSQRDSLLRAIVDSPDEDTPRLVFADWLEERGETELARYIRLSCEVEGLPATDPRFAAVKDELDALEEVGYAWADEWRQGLAEEDEKSLGIVELILDRGLYAEARMAAPYRQKVGPFRRAWEHLLTHAPIRRVSVQGVDSRIARFLATTPTLLRLNELEVIGDDQTGGINTVSSVVQLARSPYLANLRLLRLYALLPRGRRPDASNDPIAYALTESPHLATLQKLRVSLIPLSDAAWQRLRDRFGDRLSW